MKKRQIIALGLVMTFNGCDTVTIPDTFTIENNSTGATTVVVSKDNAGNIVIKPVTNTLESKENVTTAVKTTTDVGDVNILNNDENIKLEDNIVNIPTVIVENNVTNIPSATADVDKNISKEITINTLEFLKNDINVITSNSAKLHIVSNEKTSTLIKYGIDEGYGEVIEEESFISDHTEVLKNLEPNTKYHYQVTVTDENGNTQTSSDKVFRTLEDKSSTSDTIVEKDKVRDDDKKIFTEKFINLFERSDPNDYGYDTASELDDKDDRGLTVGRIFITGSSKDELKKSDSYKVIEAYKDAGGNDKIIETYDADDYDEIINMLKEQWPVLAKKEDKQGILFREAQDKVYEETVYQKAKKASQVLNGSGLVILNLLSAYVLHGEGRDNNSTDGMIRLAGEKTNIEKFTDRVSEKKWVKAFLNERKREFCGDKEHIKAISILDTLNYLLDNDDFDLIKNSMDIIVTKRSEFETIYEKESNIAKSCSSTY